jgi:hypothetical protein
MKRFRPLAALLLGAACVPHPGAGAEDPPAPLIPTESVWVMRYDDKLDGEVKATPGGGVRWKLSARNDRLSGSLAGRRDADPTDHRLSGEVVAGQPPIVALRQDGPLGLVAYYTGKRVAVDRIVGTWYDNRGGSGDFEFTVEKIEKNEKNEKK